MRSVWTVFHRLPLGRCDDIGDWVPLNERSHDG